MAIKLYGWGGQSSARKVQWALEELGLGYEWVALDRQKQEHRTPEYLAVNPNGKVPGFVEDGVKVFESSAILVHLGEKHGVERGLWPRGNAQERADALSWTVWATADFNAFLAQYVYHGLDSPVSYPAEHRSKPCAEYNLYNVRSHLDMIERRLEGRDWLMGAAFTLVDVAVYDVMTFALWAGVDLGDRPRLKAWIDRCKARPAFERTLAKSS